MREIILIAHNLRSSHNVGSLLRTADGLGIKTVYLSGYTPYPKKGNDKRLPHIADKLTKQITKTALGAEDFIDWQHADDVIALIEDLRRQGFQITALEQSPKSVRLTSYNAPNKVAIIVGREVEGIEPEILQAADDIIEIPMYGKKESFNVVQAAAMAMYQLRFME